jgi:hypothetical protein
VFQWERRGLVVVVVVVVVVVKIKVKVKLSLWLTKHHAMKTYWGSGGVALRIINIGTRWRRVASFTLRSLYLGYPLDRKLGGPQSRSGRGGEEWVSF